MKVSHSKVHGAETVMPLTDSHEVVSNNGNSLEPLKPNEWHQLEQCEAILRRGLATFFEVGQALLTIRVARLYRENFPTFEVYCRERWAMGRTYAWHLMGAAQRVKLLTRDSKAPKPSNEFQVRPFLKLEAEAFPKAWEQVIARANGGRITSALVRGVLAELAPQSRMVNSHPKIQRRINTLPSGCSLGAILVLLSEAKTAMEKGDATRAVQTITRVEGELLGTRAI